ncbi:MAG: hypothetical protein ACRBN8_21120 [Nannocystales bacterium]
MPHTDLHHTHEYIMKTLRPITLASFLGTLTLASIAFAAPTYENNPGAACVATGDNPLSVRIDGEAENQTSSGMYAVCPAERPVDDLATEVSGRVFVVDQHPTSNACCRAASKNPSGSYQYSSWECSSGSSSGYQILDVDPVNDGYSWSHFMLQCYLPPMSGNAASRIQTYRVIQD